MEYARLVPSVKTSAATWIADRLAPFSEYVIASTVPAGFEAYARVLHPVRSKDEKPMRWAQLAAASGRIAHASMTEWEWVAAEDRWILLRFNDACGVPSA